MRFKMRFVKTKQDFYLCLIPMQITDLSHDFAVFEWVKLHFGAYWLETSGSRVQVAAIFDLHAQFHTYCVVDYMDLQKEK